jgi:general secretion pathway protein D
MRKKTMKFTNLPIFPARHSPSQYPLKPQYQLRPIVQVLMMVFSLSLSACATAPWPVSKILGKTPEDKVASAKEKSDKKPEEAIPLKDLRLTQDKAVADLLKEAETAQKNGNIDEAVSLYARVVALDGNNRAAKSALKEMERDKEHIALVEDARKQMEQNKLDAAQTLVRKVLLENPSQVDALVLQKELKEKRGLTRSEPPKLKPPFDKPVSLELRDANIKMVFEALSRATGINFILDKDIRPDTKATVFIKKATIEEAIDMVLSSNGLQKKALSETSALVFPSLPQKVKDYQELMIHSFYLTNTTAKQTGALLRTILKSKDIYIDDRLNMIVIRDTPEVIRIAEKLIAANDMADPEVMLEIEVLEVSRSRLQELGLTYPSQISVNNQLRLDNSVTTATGVVGSSTTFVERPLTIFSLQNLDSSSLSVSPNPAINFRKTMGDVNLLSNPRIRVRNNEKAKVLVGDKVPIITSNVTGTASTVTESVQYVDVGLKLDVEPRITLDDYVNIKIGLEVSSLGEKTVTKSGSTVYTIGTRNANTILRLKNGETQILAGLISDDERKSSSGLPGLADLPLLGRLFKNQENRKNKTEIVLSITPHVLGNLSRPDAEVSEYWSGTDATINDRPQTSGSPVLGGSRAGGANIPQLNEPPPGETIIPGEVVEPTPVAPPPLDNNPQPLQQSGEAPSGGVPGLSP